MPAFGAKAIEAMLIDLKIDANDWHYEAVRAVWSVAHEGCTTIDAFVREFGEENVNLVSVDHLVGAACLYLRRGTPRHEVNTAVLIAKTIVGDATLDRLEARFSIDELTQRSRRSDLIELREAAYAAWVIGERETAIEVLGLRLEPAFLETVLDV